MPFTRQRRLPPPRTDASGLGLVAVLVGLLALTVGFVATGGTVLDAWTAFGRRPAGSVLDATARASAAPSAPAASASSRLGSGVAPSPAESKAPSAEPSASARPVRAPVRVDLLANRDPRRIFVSEATDVLCAAAGVQMTVELLTGRADRSRATQLRIHALAVALTTRRDSHNGGTGPAGMARTITRLAGVPYELRIASTRNAALRDAAVTLTRTREPIVLLAWRGAHTWVMTGFRADGDPAVFADARIRGTYILDPWYPRVSSIWGPSDPPNAWQDSAEMVRNYLPWKRPEGHYPGRDGRFLYLAPVERGD